MNIYVVVEGRSTEPAVYRSWIPLVNPVLKPVDYITQVTTDNVYIVSGGGYPSIYSTVKAAILDTNADIRFDRLVVALDSEDETRDARLAEVQAIVNAGAPRVDVRVIIQHFCFETWALGNRVAIPSTPNQEPLITFRKHHDVRVLDPENLAIHPEQKLNRAQLAGKYLRAALRQRNLSYSKSNPSVVAHPKYFKQVQNRLVETGHIKSFDDFVLAFS